jgi:predicted transcriptional regulator
MKILLSIKPEFADKIMSGEKRYEYRKTLHKHPNVQSALVYVTQPVGKLVCEFDISAIVKLSPAEMWKKTAAWSGISKEFFDSYFENRQYAFALQIGAVNKYDVPRDPREVFDDFVPPQSFMYVPQDVRPKQDSLFPELI